jgi:hypothetical protein
MASIGHLLGEFHNESATPIKAQVRKRPFRSAIAMG